MIVPLEKFWSALTAKPCNEQREIVEREWPSGIPLRAETIWRTRDLGLNLDWVATYLPAPFQSKYEEKHTSIQREYDEKMESYWREYKEKITLVWHEYDAKHSPILHEFNEKRALALHEYKKKRALLLLEILTKVFSGGGME